MISTLQYQILNHWVIIHAYFNFSIGFVPNVINLNFIFISGIIIYLRAIIHGSFNFSLVTVPSVIKFKLIFDYRFADFQFIVTHGFFNFNCDYVPIVVNFYLIITPILADFPRFITHVFFNFSLNAVPSVTNYKFTFTIFIASATIVNNRYFSYLIFDLTHFVFTSSRVITHTITTGFTNFSYRKKHCRCSYRL